MATIRGRMRIPAPLVLVSADGVALDTLAVVAGYETHVFDGGDAAVPYGRELHVTVNDDRVYVGEASEMEFRVLGLDGRVHRSVRIPGYDLTIPEAERDSIRRAILTSAPQLPPVLRPVAEDRAADIPHRRPAYSGLVVDSEAFVWLAPYLPRGTVSSQPRDWLVFGPRGEWMGNVSLPPRFELDEAGSDYLLGRSRDELGVETVQLLRLIRPRP